MYVYLTNLHTLWKLKSSYKDGALDPIFGKKGYPQFQKDCRWVEYKTTDPKLADNRKTITFTEKKRIGRLKLKGTRDLHFYSLGQLKR
jgi:putative transposase